MKKTIIVTLLLASQFSLAGLADKPHENIDSASKALNAHLNSVLANEKGAKELMREIESEKTVTEFRVRSSALSPEQVSVVKKVLATAAIEAKTPFSGIDYLADAVSKRAELLPQIVEMISKKDSAGVKFIVAGLKNLDVYSTTVQADIAAIFKVQQLLNSSNDKMKEISKKIKNDVEKNGRSIREALKNAGLKGTIEDFIIC